MVALVKESSFDTCYTPDDSVLYGSKSDRRDVRVV